MEYTTISKMATELGVSPAKVSYIVRKLGIEPMGHAGLCRLYNPCILEKVRDGLAMLRHYIPK